jgi:hypothetical protein
MNGGCVAIHAQPNTTSAASQAAVTEWIGETDEGDRQWVRKKAATCRCKCSTTGLSGVFSLDISSAIVSFWDPSRFWTAALLSVI